MLGDRRLSRQRLRDIGFAAAAFALSGVITDLQYRGMAWAFGTGTGPRDGHRSRCSSTSS